MVVDLTGGSLPCVVHWGSDLGDLDHDVLAALRLATRPLPLGFAVDGEVETAVLPEASAGWLGTPGLAGHRDGTGFSTAFRVTGVSTTTTDDGTQRLAVAASDTEVALELHHVLELTAQGLVRQRARLLSTGSGTYTLDGLLITLPVPARATELLDFTGRHLRERSPQRTAFTHGTRLRDNRRGRTGYDSAYLLVAGAPGFANRSGETWGLHTAWSGNHRTLAERRHDSAGLLGGGELLLPGEVRLARGEEYTSPWAYGSYGVGLDALSARFHEWCVRVRSTRAHRDRWLPTRGRRSTSTTTSRDSPSSRTQRPRSARSASCSTTAGLARAATTRAVSGTGTSRPTSGPTVSVR